MLFHIVQLVHFKNMKCHYKYNQIGYVNTPALHKHTFKYYVVGMYLEHCNQYQVITR